jgi:hypothetical protein
VCGASDIRQQSQPPRAYFTQPVGAPGTTASTIGPLKRGRKIAAIEASVTTSAAAQTIRARAPCRLTAIASAASHTANAERAR